MAQIRTLRMAAGAGYAMAIGSGSVTLLSRAECWIQAVAPQVTAPTAPTESPAPSAGEVAEWMHMVGDEVQTISGLQVWYLRVWAVAAGNLVVNAP